MGLERVLQAAGVAVALAGAASAAPREEVGIIDVGPDDGGAARQAIAAAITDAGLAADSNIARAAALRGIDLSPDAVALAAQLSAAQAAFGKLDCTATVTAARQAVGLAAARQAAGLAVPELASAWTYVLLCADRAGDSTAAHVAAARLRSAGGSPGVPAAILDKYPEVDALLDRQTFALEISADVPGAAIWVDGASVGTAPVTVHLLAGEHVIAAAQGTRRGFATGTASAAQSKLSIPTADQVGPYRSVAARVASWGRNLPAAEQVTLVLEGTRLRALIARHDDQLEVWGRARTGEEATKLGGDDGAGSVAEAPRLAGLVAERVVAWDDRAPDPDALLVETPQDRALRAAMMEKKKAKSDEPARWWVYGALGGAAVLAVGLLYFTETDAPTQRLELHVP